MQNQISPLILSFGASDPVSATGLFADIGTFAAMACHGLPVVTSVLTGDTAQIDSIHALEADLIDEQARSVLEDMPVAAIKLGQAGSVDNVTTIAEIASDYPDLPFVLDPFHSEVNEQTAEAEDLILAIRELLIPQASVLVISAVELSRLAETWKDQSEDDDLTADVMTLIDSGCKFVLVTGTQAGNNEFANTLFNEAGVVRRDVWQRIPGSHAGAGTTLSAAITALLACGIDVPEAVLEAQEFTHAALRHAQQLGMGKLIPDRFFWAREALPDSAV